MENLEIERIHTPFLMERDWNSHECYYGDVFETYSLLGDNPDFNILMRRHYSLLKQSGKTWVYTLWLSYHDEVILLVQVFTEQVANSVIEILSSASIQFHKKENNQKYKNYLNFSWTLPIWTILDI
jgi:hypothetical protein